MKSIMIRSITLILFSLLLTVCTSLVAFGQSARLQLGNLDKLEAVADQTVDVTVDQKVLGLARIFLGKSKNPNEQKIKELIAEVQGIYVKHFSFERTGQYSLTDIEAIRAQLNGPSWVKMVNVRSKRKSQTIDVYTMLDGNKVGGLAVIAAEAKELTIVNIVGPIDLEKLSSLEGTFGIPDLEIVSQDKTQKE